MTVKNSKTKSLEISTESYEKLRIIKDFLENVFRKNVTFDDVLKVILSPKIVDYSEMTLTHILVAVAAKEKPAEAPTE
jgi:hypothetical protein